MNRSSRLPKSLTMYRYAYAEYLENLCVDSGLLSEINRNQQFIDIMKKSFRKKPYETMALRELALEGGSSLLGASIIIDSANIDSVGQPVGAVYDFTDTAEDGGHVFNQDWDAGIVE